LLIAFFVFLLRSRCWSKGWKPFQISGYKAREDEMAQEKKNEEENRGGTAGTERRNPEKKEKAKNPGREEREPEKKTQETNTKKTQETQTKREKQRETERKKAPGRKETQRNQRNS
jgi:hypothetical protein